MSWVGRTATDIALAVRAGETTAVQVLADHLEHLAVADAAVNAFRIVCAAPAMAEAEQVDARPDRAELPLAGVPVAVKENTPVAGLPTWHGSIAARQEVAEVDHEVVRRLRAAGAIVVGTTRMPELGVWGTTDDETGITRNPWQPERTAGGSSGGSAAAVAAGIVPLAHGNDGLGSVRIPAACCGLVGVKPGRGVVPVDLPPDGWFGLTEHGVLATTVADAATGLAVLAARTPVEVDLGGLRIAVSHRSPVAGVRADRGFREALSTTVQLLTGLGHDAVRAGPAFPLSLQPRGLATWFAGVYRAVDHAGLDPRSLQPRTRRHAALGRTAYRRGWVREADREAFRAQVVEFFSHGPFDLLVTPVLAGRPPAAVAWSDRSWRANITANARYAPYAAPWNLAGLPAIAVPTGVRTDGLPAGVQLVGPPGAEDLLLAVAAQLESARPWTRHAPGWPRTA